jgi:hypothetical protein
MPRKRKDFGEAPIDGDYSRDQVINKRPGCRYVWALDEDIPEMRARGFKRVERAEDGPAPRFDEFAESGAAGDVPGQNRLVLMEADESRVAAREQHERKTFNAQLGQLQRQSKRGTTYDERGISVVGDVSQQVSH